MAKQVGKAYILQNFGRQYYKDIVCLNCKCNNVRSEISAAKRKTMVL